MSEDIRACDVEPIHLIQNVQSHGCLLAFNPGDRRIQAISENAAEILGKPNRDLLGGKIDHIFEVSVVERIAALIKTHPWDVPGRHLPVRPTVNQKQFDTYLYETEGLFVIELEEFQSTKLASELEIETEQMIREFMILCKRTKNVQELSKLVCFTFRQITGLDRVMMYRFMPPSWHGEVIAEDRVTNAHSYMGHRFPASDIPVPARDLYLRNQVRLIPDILAPVSPLNPQINPKTKKPLNLSDSRLRAVAPIHLEYLKNMKVGASFSVAVTHNEKLWGLITCHHLTPMMIPQSQRTACEIIAHTFSVQAPLLEEGNHQRERLEFEIKTKKILESLRQSANPMDDFFKQHRTVTEAFDGGGIALVTDKLQDFAGLTPLRGDTEELANWLRRKMDADHKDYLALENLSEIDGKWAGIKDLASGVLAVRLPDISNSVLMVFRPEVLTTIIWGGDPKKQLGKRDFQGQINPRVSFDAWQETVTKHSKPWKKFEIDGLLFFRDFVFDGLVKKERIIKELTHELRKH